MCLHMLLPPVKFYFYTMVHHFPKYGLSKLEIKETPLIRSIREPPLSLIAQVRLDIGCFKKQTRLKYEENEKTVFLPFFLFFPSHIK